MGTGFEVNWFFLKRKKYKVDLQTGKQVSSLIAVTIYENCSINKVSNSLKNDRNMEKQPINLFWTYQTKFVFRLLNYHGVNCDNKVRIQIRIQLYITLENTNQRTPIFQYICAVYIEKCLDTLLHQSKWMLATLKNFPFKYSTTV